jgi:hypothetical protein
VECFVRLAQPDEVLLCICRCARLAKTSWVPYVWLCGPRVLTLEGDVPRQARVLCLVHHTHSATAELLDETVKGDRLPGQRVGSGHSRRHIRFWRAQVNESTATGCGDKFIRPESCSVGYFFSSEDQFRTNLNLG